MFRKGIKILHARFGLVSNNEDLLPKLPLKIFITSLLTDYHKVEEIEFADDLDCYFLLLDNTSYPDSIQLSEKNVIVSGSLKYLTENASDLRFSIFGNEGLLFRYVLFILEKNYNTYSFHASSLYDEKKKRMYIIAGGAGAGKSVYLFTGLMLGFKLFSTEMTHFKIDGQELIFYKGSLIDNVRIGNLKYNFPDFMKLIDISADPETNDEWGVKFPLDLSMFQTESDKITNPELIIIFPRIEEGRKSSLKIDINDRKKIIKNIYDNVSSKIGETILLYDKIPVCGIDNIKLAEKRYESINKFTDLGRICRVINVLSNVEECWKDII